MSDSSNLIVNVMKLTAGCCYAAKNLSRDSVSWTGCWTFWIIYNLCPMIFLVNGSRMMSDAIVSLLRVLMTCDVARVWPTLYLHYPAHYQLSSHSQPNFRASINIWHGKHPWNICTNHLSFIIVFSCLLLSSLVAHEYMKNKHAKAEEEQCWNSLRAPEWIGDYSTLFMLHFNKFQWKIIDLSILAKGPAVTPMVDTGQDTLNLTGVHLTFDRFTLIWNVEILASSHRP